MYGKCIHHTHKSTKKSIPETGRIISIKTDMISDNNYDKHTNKNNAMVLTFNEIDKDNLYDPTSFTNSEYYKKYDNIQKKRKLK